eukprot:COSAG05_NODE_67_length_22197_cov_42.906417_2_plen_84_part_00
MAGASHPRPCTLCARRGVRVWSAVRCAYDVVASALGCSERGKAEVVEAERGGVEVAEVEVVAENSYRERPPQTWRTHRDVSYN